MRSRIARVGFALLGVSLLAMGALLAEGKAAHASSASVGVPGEGTYRLAALLSGRAVDYRISSPPAFNLTLSIYGDKGAAERLSGREATPLATRTAARPFTLHFEPAKLGTYLIEVQNHDAGQVFVILSEETLADVDRAALWKAGGAGMVGALLAAWGISSTWLERRRAGDQEPT